MMVMEVIKAVRDKGKTEVFTQVMPEGIAIGVPSSVPGIAHWSLVPVEDESRPKFVEFMVSLVGKKPAKEKR